MPYQSTYIISAHDHCSNNQAEILKSKQCGCFYCKRTFPATDIKEWIDDPNGMTAQCPKCGIDAVLSDQFPIEDSDFLREMHLYWFL